MSIKCKDIIDFFNIYSPDYLAESYDNVGLLIGSKSRDISRVMVCLDVTMDVVEEAIKKGVDLIVSHHPIIFRGIKKIVSDDVKGNIIYKLIQNNISVYSAHTNLDTTFGGVNDFLAQALNLKNISNLKKHWIEKIYKVIVYVPAESVEEVRTAMCDKGAGWIGNYSNCTFMTKGIGTFMPLEGTNPYIGQKGNLEKVDEYRLETIVPEAKLRDVINVMKRSHPYEEVAYDIFDMKIGGKEYGLGKVGNLKNPLSLEEFITNVKNKLEVDKVRLIGDVNKKINKVAVFCGSFDNDFAPVLKQKADVLVTGDIKYHDAMDMLDAGLCVIDAGHFNTEKVLISRVVELISNEFKELDVFSNNVERDPFKFV